MRLATRYSLSCRHCPRPDRQRPDRARRRRRRCDRPPRVPARREQALHRRQRQGGSPPPRLRRALGGAARGHGPGLRGLVAPHQRGPGRRHGDRAAEAEPLEAPREGQGLQVRRPAVLGRHQRDRHQAHEGGREGQGHRQRRRLVEGRRQGERLDRGDRLDREGAVVRALLEPEEGEQVDQGDGVVGARERAPARPSTAPSRRSRP